MKDIPVTYLFNWGLIESALRPWVLHEFAANGAENLVLSDTLLRQMYMDRTLADTLRREMAAEGLSFADAHASFGIYLDLNCPVPEARGEMISRLKTQLYMIHSMGVKTVTIHTGNETQYPEYDLEVQFECIKRSLDELLVLAEELQIVINIENIWHRLNTPERLLALKEAFPTDSLGFCFDAGHANLMRNVPEHSPESRPCKAWGELTPAWDDHILEKMLPHVVSCHLHDNDGINDLHGNIGSGTVDWKKTMDLLEKAPRLQVIQCEASPVRARTAIRELCETFRNLPGLSAMRCRK